MKRKNTMLSIETKEIIIKRYKNGESVIKLSKEYNFTRQHFYVWLSKYEEKGINGLKSNTGKASNYHKNMGLHLRKPRNKIEELELEILKKDIEIARLKKGYMVKGVGAEKEYVTTLNKNIK